MGIVRPALWAIRGGENRGGVKNGRMRPIRRTHFSLRLLLESGGAWRSGSVCLGVGLFTSANSRPYSAFVRAWHSQARASIPAVEDADAAPVVVY